MSSDEREGETGPVIIPVGLKPNKNRYFVCGVGSHCNQGMKLKVVMKDDCHGSGPTHPNRNTVDVTWLGSELTLSDNKLCVELGKPLSQFEPKPSFQFSRHVNCRSKS